MPKYVFTSLATLERNYLHGIFGSIFKLSLNSLTNQPLSNSICETIVYSHSNSSCLVCCTNPRRHRDKTNGRYILPTAVVLSDCGPFYTNNWLREENTFLDGSILATFWLFRLRRRKFAVGLQMFASLVFFHRMLNNVKRAIIFCAHAIL